MRLERFYDDDLAQASYLIGCEASGEALIVDPNLRLDQYVEAAQRAGLRITAVAETHIHADFLSGARALAHHTGAHLYLSGEGPADWQYAFDAPRLTRVHGGDRLRIGNVQVEVWHTPGHTPEHLCFLVTDTARGEAPVGLCAGDFVFVGDIGRPDLLETVAGVGGSKEAAARQLFASLQRFKQLPDYVQVWPGHGAGSACGKAMGAMPHSTVGYERHFNWALQVGDEAAFVRSVLAGQPEPPAYFARMKRLNRDAQPTAPPALDLAPIGVEPLERFLAGGGVVVDTRSPEEFSAGHIPNTVNVPLRRGFTSWAGALFPENPEILFIGEETAAREAAARLALIGFDRFRGFAAPEVLALWRERGRPLATLPRIASRQAFDRWRAGQGVVLDVRGRAEYRAGHIPAALLVPLPELPRRLGEVPPEQPLLVHCQGGLRSAVAASYLAAHGYGDVTNVDDGFAGWQRSDLPVERDAPAPSSP